MSYPYDSQLKIWVLDPDEYKDNSVYLRQCIASAVDYFRVRYMELSKRPKYSQEIGAGQNAVAVHMKMLNSLVEEMEDLRSFLIIYEEDKEISNSRQTLDGYLEPAKSFLKSTQSTASFSQDLENNLRSWISLDIRKDAIAQKKADFDDLKANSPEELKQHPTIEWCLARLNNYISIRENAEKALHLIRAAYEMDRHHIDNPARLHLLIQNWDKLFGELMIGTQQTGSPPDVSVIERALDVLSILEGKIDSENLTNWKQHIKYGKFQGWQEVRSFLTEESACIRSIDQALKLCRENEKPSWDEASFNKYVCSACYVDARQMMAEYIGIEFAREENEKLVLISDKDAQEKGNQRELVQQQEFLLDLFLGISAEDFVDKMESIVRGIKEDKDVVNSRGPAFEGEKFDNISLVMPQKVLPILITSLLKANTSSDARTIVLAPATQPKKVSKSVLVWGITTLGWLTSIPYPDLDLDSRDSKITPSQTRKALYHQSKKCRDVLVDEIRNTWELMISCTPTKQEDMWFGAWEKIRRGQKIYLKPQPWWLRLVNHVKPSSKNVWDKLPAELRSGLCAAYCAAPTSVEILNKFEDYHLDPKTCCPCGSVQG